MTDGDASSFKDHVKLIELGVDSAALLAELHRETFAEAAADIWDEADFSSILALPTTHALAAVDVQGAPIGFTVFSRVADESEILTLGVVPARRKAGVGHLLVAAVINRARHKGVRSIFLEVREDNEAALLLYRHHRFIITGRRKAYYRRATGGFVDAVIMCCNTR